MAYFVVIGFDVVHMGHTGTQVLLGRFKYLCLNRGSHFSFSDPSSLFYRIGNSCPLYLSFIHWNFSIPISSLI